MGDLYSVRVVEVAPEERRVRLDDVVVAFDFVYRIPKPLPEPSDPTFFLGRCGRPATRTTARRSP